MSWLTGIMAMATGASVYWLDRPAGLMQWMPWLGRAEPGTTWGSVGQWWPSFAHAFAFSLFSVLLLRRTRAWTISACTFWAIVDVLFELTQHAALKAELIAWLQSDAARTFPLLQAVARFGLRGTFDWGDAAACVAGAAAAAWLMWPDRRHTLRTGDLHVG